MYSLISFNIFIPKVFYSMTSYTSNLAKEEYKQLSCCDIGMACGFQVRAKTEAEVMKLAKTHAAEAHGLKEISVDTEKKIKAAIKTVSTDVPEKK